MAGPNKFGPPCGCCECPQFLVVNVRCTNGSIVAGATVTVKDAGLSTIATGTTDGTGGVHINFMTAPGTITVEATKAGYTTASTSIDFSSCNASKSATLTICPTSFVLKIRTISCSSTGSPSFGPIIPGDYAVTGDVSASGTLDSSGSADVTITMPGGSCTVSLLLTVTAPSGYGASPATEGILVNSCQDYTAYIGWAADSTHAPVIYGDRFLPKTLTYTDAKGTCTLTWDSSGYKGTYTYSSHEALGLGCGDGTGGGPEDGP